MKESRQPTWKTLLPALLWAVLLPATARALPAGLKHVDSKAPCYRWPAADYDGDGVFDRIDRCPNTPNGCAVDEYGCPHDADGDGVCDELDRCANTSRGERVDKHGCSASQDGAAQEQGMPPAVLPPAIPEPRSEVERQLVTSGKVLFENINFETGTARLMQESESRLDDAGEALERYPALKVEIDGHTDSRGSAASNMRLSKSRAQAVRQYLLDRFRLKPDHLIARGRGESEPLNREANAQELLQNRRVELKVLNPEALPGNVKVEH